MIQALLEIFTTTEKAEAMLASPMIEFIFTTLFILFIFTILVHFILFFKIRHIRNYVNNTARLDMEPLRTFEKEFEKRQAGESIQVETFVQERSEEHTSELQSRGHLVCRLLLEKKKHTNTRVNKQHR